VALYKSAHTSAPADTTFQDFHAEEGPIASPNTGSDVFFDRCTFQGLTTETSGLMIIVSGAKARAVTGCPVCMLCPPLCLPCEASMIPFVLACSLVSQLQSTLAAGNSHPRDL
jgi:hypothetical protein